MRQGVAVTITSGTDGAKIDIETTCYADEEWEPRWDEIATFVANNHYRILEVIDSRELRKEALRKMMQELSLPPLTPVNTE